MEEEKMEYSEEKPSAKKTMKEKTKKYLAGFVILMLVCTVISRATASVTTPMVTVVTPKRGSLSYKVEGTGVIEASSEVFFPVEAEMKIDEVFVKAGDTVEEGQQLFTYNMEALEEKIKVAKANLKSSEMAYEKQALTDSLAQAKTDTDTQQTALKRAQDDYDRAVAKLEEVKESYAKKVEKIKENLSKEKQTEYDTANKEYEDAKDAYDSLDETCEKAYNEAVKAIETAKKEQDKAVKEANDSLADATSSRDELSEKRDKLESYIQEFTYYAKCKDLQKCETVMTNIYNEYFGKDNYKSIKKSISSAQTALSEANEDLQNLTKKWDLSLEKSMNKINSLEVGSDEYKEAYDSYQESLLTRETELLAAQRLVNSAYDNFINVNSNYTAINDAATAYRSYLFVSADGNDTTLYQKFHDSVVDDSVFDEKAYTKAQAQVTKKEQMLSDTVSEQAELVADAQQKAQDAKKEWEKKLKKEEKKVQEAQDKLTKLLDKVYSGEDDIKTAWNEVEAQKDTVRAAKRSLEDAKAALQSAQESLNLAESNEAIQDKIDSINLESLKMDVENNTERLEKLNKLYESGGSVCTTVAGMIANFEISQQAQVTGSEKVSVTPSSCVFTGTFDKDNRKYVEEGATIACTLDTMEKAVDAEILSIRYDQVNNNYSFTAKLPDGEYLPKTGGSYTFTQQSAKYDATVPISALRKENNNYYVLILSESETILGTETIAYRVNVEVTSKDTQTAAITNVYSDMQVITGSSRNIAEGDRVRIGNYE